MFKICAETLLKKTWISETEFPKFIPRMVSVIPNFPDAGEIELIFREGADNVVSVLLHANEIIAIERDNLRNEISLRKQVWCLG